MRIGRGSGGAQLVIWAILGLVIVALVVGMVLLSTSTSSGSAGVSGMQAPLGHAVVAGAGLRAGGGAATQILA